MKRQLALARYAIRLSAAIFTLNAEAAVHCLEEAQAFHEKENST